MNGPTYRRPAFSRPTQPDQAMTVDWADVTAQAVANERYRVLRELRIEVEKMRTTKDNSDRYSYRSDPRSADDFQREVLDTIDDLEKDS